MKNKIRFFVIYVLVSFFLISCNDIFFENLEKDNLENINTINNIPKNCVPVYLNISNQTKSKTVLIPDFASINIQKYKISATSDTYGIKEFEFDSTQSILAIYLELNTQWTVTVDGYNSTTISDEFLVLSGTSQIITGNSSLNCSITISPIVNDFLKGSVSVTVLFSQANCAYTVSTYLDGNLVGQPEVIDVTSSAQTKIYSFDNVEVGNRVIKFKIVNNLYSNYPVYKIINANVYSNLVSSKILTTTGSDSETIIFSETDLTPETLEDYALYVLGASSESVQITSDTVACEVFGKEKAIKFTTIQEAVDFVESVDPNGCVESSIFVDGLIMQEPDAGVESLVTIGDSSNTPNIKIIGRNNAAGLFVNTINYLARGIFVNSNATVTISGVTISSGNSSNSSGGGIYSSGNLILENVSIINSIANAGGGIYSNGILTMNNCTIEQNNSTTSGGGLYIEGNTKLTGVTIKSNTAVNSGGGIYKAKDGYLVMKNGAIEGNNATTGNGGGLTFYGAKGSDTFTSPHITQSYLDSVSITENSANASGDGIYIVSNNYLSLGACTVKRNDTQDIGLKGNLYLSLSSKIGTIHCFNENNDGTVVNVSINLHSSFALEEEDPQVEVSLDKYVSDLILLSLYSTDGSINEFVGLFKLPDSVTDYEISLEGKLENK